MTQDLLGKFGHLALALAWGAVLVLVGLLAAAAQPAASSACTNVTQELAGAARLIPADEPGFSLEITPTHRTILQGASTFYSVTVSVLPTHTAAISLSVQGIPAGTEVALNPNPISTTATVRLDMTTSLTAPQGVWPLTVTGESEGIGQTVQFTLQVDALATSDFGLSVQPAEQQVMPRYSTNFTISITALSGFASPVYLEVGKMPTGTVSSIIPISLTPPGEAMLTLFTTQAAPLGTHRLVITATGGNLTHTAPLTLTIIPLHSTFLPIVTRGYDYLCTWDEPNDIRAEAISLAPYTDYESHICPQDLTDIFSISVQSLTPLIISLTNLTNLPPGADYDLYLFDASSKDPIAWSNQYGQVDEHIVYPITTTGMYYIHVLPYSGSSREVPYNLTAIFDYEPNDNLETAYGPLQTGRVYRAYLWSAADFVDYYYTDVPTTSTISISLTNLVNLPAGVDYDLYLLNGAGDLVAWSNQYGQVNEYLVHPVTDDFGRYYIQVLAYSGFTNEIPYLLTVRQDQ